MRGLKARIQKKTYPVYTRFLVLTLKKFAVAPPFFAPNFIPLSSATSTNSFKFEKWGSGFSVVKKAAKLAVYEETMSKVKNHHIPATIRVGGDLEHKS